MKDLFEILLENSVDEETAYNIVEKANIVKETIVKILGPKEETKPNKKAQRHLAIMKVLNDKKPQYLKNISKIQGRGNYPKYLNIPELTKVVREYKNVSDSCYKDVLDLVHYYLCEAENEPINFEKEKMAREINKMMQDGSLEDVHQTADGSAVMGTNIEKINKLNAMKKRAMELNNEQ